MVSLSIIWRKAKSDISFSPTNANSLGVTLESSAEKKNFLACRFLLVVD
jgi:hypothetical protein